MTATQPETASPKLKPSKISAKQREEAFRSIVSHRRKVSIVKRSLFVIALVLMVALILWPQFNPVEKQLKLSFTKITEGDSGKPQMLNPQYQGIDEHGQSYKIYADTATQESEQQVSLSNISGDIALQNNGWVKFSADNGHVNLEKNEALLTGNVHITADSGYDLKTEHVEVFLKKGTAIGNVPVIIIGPLGQLDATGFVLDNNAKTITFTGPVKTVLQPGKKGTENVQ